MSVNQVWRTGLYGGGCVMFLQHWIDLVFQKSYANCVQAANKEWVISWTDYDEHDRDAVQLSNEAIVAKLFERQDATTIARRSYWNQSQRRAQVELFNLLRDSKWRESHRESTECTHYQSNNSSDRAYGFHFKDIAHVVCIVEAVFDPVNAEKIYQASKELRKIYAYAVGKKPDPIHESMLVEKKKFAEEATKRRYSRQRMYQDKIFAKYRPEIYRCEIALLQARKNLEHARAKRDDEIDAWNVKLLKLEKHECKTLQICDPETFVPDEKPKQEQSAKS